VQGPNSRDLLQSLTTFDMSNEAFPFGTSQIIDIGYARVRASRVTGHQILVFGEQNRKLCQRRPQDSRHRLWSPPTS
jgi:hypothetical protein